MKFDLTETISTGKAKIVIENGQLNIANLKKLRMSVDRLETRLRQSGITSIEDVKHATIEFSGLLGYELQEDKQAATKAEIKELLDEITHLKQALGVMMKPAKQERQSSNIFTEVKNKQFEGENEP
ncbi:YetF domain-containing protein [Amphibacillus indicireducens]